jgi:hypothetical protein
LWLKGFVGWELSRSIDTELALAALPGTMGVTEEDLEPSVDAQLGVL